LNDLVQSNLAVIVAVLAAAVVVLTLVGVVAIWQVARLRRRLNNLTRGADGLSLEGVLDAHLESVTRVSRELSELTVRTGRLEASALRHYSRVGLVRFNPFEDTGGNQSFALVLLDDREDGLVMSSLHARNGTRLYAKVLTSGRCDVALSAEEEQALRLARRQALGGDRGSGERVARDRSTGTGWSEEETAPSVRLEAARRAGAVAAGRGVRRRSDGGSGPAVRSGQKRSS
jgi:hypothetical protein